MEPEVFDNIDEALGIWNDAKAELAKAKEAEKAAKIEFQSQVRGTLAAGRVYKSVLYQRKVWFDTEDAYHMERYSDPDENGADK